MQKMDNGLQEDAFMKMLIGGAVFSVLGVVFLGVWWKEFFNLLAGFIPLMIVLGGGLAIYLGFDEYKNPYEDE